MKNSDICETHSPQFSERRPKLDGMLLEASGLSELFKALADETRTKILYLLSDGDLCVCELAELLGMSLPAVSHHLRLLKIMRLVSNRRDGRQVFYTLQDEHVADLIRIAREHFAESIGQEAGR